MPVVEIASLKHLTDSVWNTVKDFCKSGRAWVNYQPFTIRGTSGILVFEEYDMPGEVFQRLGRGEAEQRLIEKRALFIVVADKASPEYLV